eukprot:Gregarina_sp_Poly_1__3565@NODE_2042_length_2788_cov_40_522602_g1296_i1_p2_GENE_NODE_2042_length_2788_cov_40_522602_g1296_i1NODE_2042_length_2788_cov_40_522602_g1296_i1_p2_ORF_typecomplete_len235_score30_02RRM_1/PF00076_22/3_4e19DUF2075/PF09848_9/0_00049RRM_7/PF16367_5/0_0016RRM_2/PF04059_12/0_088RRM_5/PF13893_6/0_094Limkainb1/PF11608_8/0_2_NODE_2042_length_2788_cov_40_522602_g1296_i13211025
MNLPPNVLIPPPGSTDLSLLLGGTVSQQSVPISSPEIALEENAPIEESTGPQHKVKEQGKHLRKAAGKVWNDPSLDQWSDNDFRVFCGDLGNEVTDELLANAFRQYRSFNRAKVVRDSRTGKTKGYGFVSFNRPEDMLAAIKEMNRKYVGNRPIRVLKSKWKDRDIGSQKNKADAGAYKIVPTNAKVIKKFQGSKSASSASRNAGAKSENTAKSKPNTHQNMPPVYWASKLDGQ